MIADYICGIDPDSAAAQETLEAQRAQEQEEEDREAAEKAAAEKRWNS